MRRVTLQVLRTARRAPIRKFLQSTASRLSIPYQAFSTNSVFARTRRHGPSQILSASMQIPRYSVTALAVAVGGGVWYYQSAREYQARGLVSNSSVSDLVGGHSPSGGDIFSSKAIIPDGSRSAHDSVDTEDKLPPSGRTLIIDDDQSYVTELQEDSPLVKEAEYQGRLVLGMLTPEQATQKLRRSEESILVGRGRGVVRYDVVQMPSNNPIEDDHREKIVEVSQSVTPAEEGLSSNDWNFWGVFDGHSGWTTSAKLRQVLISFVARELNATYKSALANPAITLPSPEAIDAAIKKGFVRLDNEIVHGNLEKTMTMNSKRAAVELLAPAISGSCALLSFYDSSSKLLRVACTGDSRAVLGRRGPNGKWTATALSEDQTGGTPSEMARLRAEHPGEEYVVHKGRILGGLEPSRAFGDSIYKWSRDVQEKVKRNFFGRTPPALLKTPPYVTAEPIITTTKIEPGKGDFVVMATDGLWEMLTNEEVIGLVGRWLEAQPKSDGIGFDGKSNSWVKDWLKGPETALPVEKNQVARGDQEGQRKPIRQTQWNLDESEDRFVVEDKNAATHLVRNALGGRNQDMVCGLLTLPSPYSRRYRDDLTVEVIFFGEGVRTGTVMQNPEASAPDRGLRGKL